MASIQHRTRKDGTTAFDVVYRIDGRQSSLTFDDEKAAQAFRATVDAHGPVRALTMYGLDPEPRRRDNHRLTVADWLTHHINHLTGVEQYTIDKYGAYLRRDIAPILGDIPLEELSEEDISVWVKHLEASGNRPKTIRNKYGFLSGALNAAVPRHIARNPASGRRLPRGKGDADEHDMRMLTREEFDALYEAVTDHWKPLVRFLVVSGCRWGEAAALQPHHIDRAAGTVKIRQAWKHSSRGYEIGPPKTKRSRRTIDIPAHVLDQLDMTGEWVFTNRTGGPVRYHGFWRRVWRPAVDRAGLEPRPTPHDLRHTCASWMLNGGVPLPVVSRHLGHESIQITADIYGHVDRATSRAAADFMANWLTS